MISRVQILQGLEGASRATGVCVVIDVFRAFTTACHAIAAGASPLIPAESLEQAMAFKRSHARALLAGERFGKPMPGCDFGNSPALLEKERRRLAGRPLILATHAGTRGLLAARNASKVFAASLANAAATARHILSLQPDVVSIVPMGWAGEDPAEEDDACAEYLASIFAGSPMDTSGFSTRLRSASAAAKFFDPAQPWAPEEDFPLCLAVDSFSFALELLPGPPPMLAPVPPAAIASLAR